LARQDAAETHHPRNRWIVIPGRARCRGFERCGRSASPGCQRALG
jgi:hypothetical protein